jgi:hypothetical protein
MFRFLNDFGTHEARKVDRFEKGDLTVDTCRVSDDDDFPYETGVESPDYNDGKWVIVEQYITKKEAQAGHDKWVKIMDTDELPESLPNCAAGFAKTLGLKMKTCYRKGRKVTP